MSTQRAAAFLIFIATCMALAGCASTEEKMKAAPAPNAGFIEENPQGLATKPDRAPFNRLWVLPTLDLTRYTKIYVAPVDTRHVLAMSLWEKVNVREIKVKDDIARLAVDFRTRVETAFREDPHHRVTVVDDPKAVDDHTVVLELALVEMVPTKAGLGILGVASWAMPLGVGIPVGTAAAFASPGSVAFEARVRDGDTGALLVAAADREEDAMRVLDFKATSWYGNVHETFDNWAKAWVELANTPKDVQVRHSATFTLKPW